MIDHITLKVSDLDRAVAFYTVALAPLGYSVLMEFPGIVGMGVRGKPDLWLGHAEHVVPTHVALAGERDEIDAFHAAALHAGGRDNGAPGLRAHYHPTYYGAFVLDPDGNNIEVVSHAAPKAAKKAAARKPAAKKKAPAKKAAKKAPAKKAAAKKAAPKKGK